MAPVLMYGTAACPYCQAARALFSDLGVPFEEIRVDLEPSRREEMRQRAGGRHTVPQIWVGSQHLGGFTDVLALHQQGALEALLHAPAKGETP